MYLSKSIFSFLVVFTIVFSSCKQPGCTDPIASNYNADADKEDVGIQAKIDKEQERIDGAYTRRQPSIQEQLDIISAAELALDGRVAVFSDEIASLDTEIVRLNGLVSELRTQLSNTSVASVEEQIQPYQDQIAQLDVDLERINTQANEYEARISNIDIDTSAVDSLKTQITAIEESIVVTTNKLQNTKHACSIR